MILTFFIIFLGIILLYLGAESLVKGASSLAIRFGMAPLIVGLTVVAVGTSMPEAVASITAQFKGNHGDIAIGNIIGSNIANIGLVLGLTLLIRPLPIPKKFLEIPLLLIVSVLFALLMLGGEIARYEGIALLVGLIGFCWYQVRQHKKNSSTRTRTEAKTLNLRFVYTSIPFIILGIVLLAIGGNYFIDGCIKLSEVFNIEGRVIGLTIVALGTSAPEMATSLVAIIRKRGALALGNVIGSNIFNILFVGGCVATIKPITTNFTPFIYDLIVMVLLSTLLWLMTYHQKKLSAKHGIVCLMIYLLYFATIL